MSIPHDARPYILLMEPLVPLSLQDALSGLHVAAFARDDLYRFIVLCLGQPTRRVNGRRPRLPNDPAGVDEPIVKTERLLAAWDPPHHLPVAIHLAWAGAAVGLRDSGQPPEGIRIPGTVSPHRRRRSEEDALERWLIAHARRLLVDRPADLDAASAHARLDAATHEIQLPGFGTFLGLRAIVRGGLAIAFAGGQAGLAEPLAWVPA